MTNIHPQFILQMLEDQRDRNTRTISIHIKDYNNIEEHLHAVVDINHILVTLTFDSLKHLTLFKLKYSEYL